MGRRRLALPAVLLAGVCLAAIIALRPAAVAAAAEALPERLGDAEFWTLVGELSEPDGRFPFDNFLSNETTIQTVIPALKARARPGGAYLGVGPEQNFTYIAALEPKIAFIIDIRRQNMLEHLMYKALFELSDDRAAFVSRLFSRKRPAGLSGRSTAVELFGAFEKAQADQGLFDANLRAILDTLTRRHQLPLNTSDLTAITYVYTSFFREGPGLNYAVGGGPSVNMPTYTDLMIQTDADGQAHSYLANDRNYAVVRALQGRNLIIPVVGDFAGPKAIREVGNYLASHDTTVTAFYLSNVERYLFERRRAWRGFYTNVAVLPYTDQSLFIRAVLNRPAFTLISLLAPIGDQIKAFSDGRIRKYRGRLFTRELTRMTLLNRYRTQDDVQRRTRRARRDGTGDAIYMDNVAVHSTA